MAPPRLERRALLVVLLLAACGRADVHSKVSAANYDRSCERATDCVAVFEGDIRDCEKRFCMNAAIRTTAQTQYRNDVFAVSEQCPAFGHPCPSVAVVCPKGQCEVHPLPTGGSVEDPALTLSTAEYSQACQDVADCEAVYLGPLDCCGAPGCFNDAISAEALPQYKSDLERRSPICYYAPLNIVCGPPPARCPDWRASCDDGTCRLLFARP